MKLTQARLKEVLRYESNTGEWFWLVRKSQAKGPGDIAGSVMKDGYVTIMVDGERFLAHRLAFFYMEGFLPTKQIDHIDTNKSNNRWLNLRQATPRQNQFNHRRKITNTSGYKGVTYFRGRWRAMIRIDGKIVFLGMFNTPLLASEAYQQASNNYHKEFSRI